MRVSSDRSKCRKCGLCAAICPEIFEMDRGRGARVKHIEVPPIGDLQESCVYAAQGCPSSAIEITPRLATAKPVQGRLEELASGLGRVLVHG